MGAYESEVNDLITKIKAILEAFGGVVTVDECVDEDPIVYNGGQHQCSIIECYNPDDVTIVEYVMGTKSGEVNMAYDLLPIDILDDIAMHLHRYQYNQSH